MAASVPFQRFGFSAFWRFHMSSDVAIMGDGQMGLLMAMAVHERGVRARLWGAFPEHVAQLALQRERPERLPEARLDESVVITSDEAIAMGGATVVISAIPTQYLHDVWTRIGPHLAPGAAIVSVSKGIEIGTLRRPSEVIAHAVDPGSRDVASVIERICVLSGPTIATELAQRQPAAMLASAKDQELTGQVQQLLTLPWLRIYTNDDPLGVELAGAVKNVIALAAGMADGLNLGYNAKSALLARGLAEMARLGNAMGASLDTFFGIAGLGDLATTCFCPHGRNRTCGERLGRGESLDAILKSMSSVVEGVPTAKAVLELARKHRVEMPITETVHQILFEGLSPRDAIPQLMQRSPKPERIG
jgi:glycerol-3-phosphate dehydrogenase (NAD(P)+)